MALTRADIYHNLAVLLSSGVPLQRALRTAGGHVRSPLAAATRRMAEQLDQGLFIEVFSAEATPAKKRRRA